MAATVAPIRVMATTTEERSPGADCPVCRGKERTCPVRLTAERRAKGGA
jgi:hypothetical protein